MLIRSTALYRPSASFLDKHGRFLPVVRLYVAPRLASTAGTLGFYLSAEFPQETRTFPTGNAYHFRGTNERSRGTICIASPVCSSTYIPCRKPAACPVGLPCRSFADWDCRNGEKGFRPSVSPLDRQLGGSPRWECSVALWLAPLGMSSRTETAHKARSADNRVETSTKLS